MTFETIRTMLVGYARVSTSEQTLDLQKDALEKIGCTKIFSDVVSGARAERKGLEEALDYVREGDSLVVWRLDRLGRSLKHLIETITRLNNRKIGFKSITERLLLDSRVVHSPMAYTAFFVLLSSLKALFFKSRKHEWRFSDTMGA